MKNILRTIFSFAALAAMALSVACNSTNTGPVISVSEADAPNGVATCDPNSDETMEFDVNIDAPEGIQDYEVIVTYDGVDEEIGSIVSGEAPDFVHAFTIKCHEDAINDATTVTFKVTDNQGQTDELTLDLKLAQ